MLSFTILSGPEKGQELAIDAPGPEVLGRQGTRHPLLDARTSRRHAELRLDGGQWVLRDLGSTNGTYVNGQRLSEPTPLHEGDEVMLGRFRLQVRQAEAPERADGAGDAGSAEARQHAMPEIGVTDVGTDDDEAWAADLLGEEEQNAEQTGPTRGALAEEEGVLDLDQMLADANAGRPVDTEPADEGPLELAEPEPAEDAPGPAYADASDAEAEDVPGSEGLADDEEDAENKA